jgi:SWIM zinc finger
MSKLNNMLAAKFLAAKQQKNIISTEFIIEESTDKIYFLIEVKLDKKDESGINKTKFYKQDITSYIKNHGSLESFYKSLVVSEMLLAGYLIVPIEGGFLCVGGDEIYSMNNTECTCPAFLNNSKEPCKHLLFKNGLLEQRARINNWKLNNLN